MRNSSIDKDRHFLDQGKNLKEKIKKKFGKGLEKFKREVEELSVCVWGGDCIINLQLPKKAYSEFLYIASTSDCRTDNYI